MQDGNLFAPAPGDSQAARGRFDAQANSRRDIYTSRQGDMVAAGVLLLGAIGVHAGLTAAGIATARFSKAASLAAILGAKAAPRFR